MSRRTWFIGWLMTTVFAANAVVFLWRRRWRLTVPAGEQITSVAATPNLSRPIVPPAENEPATPPSAALTPGVPPKRRWPLSLDLTLFLLAGLVFLATRLIGLDRWPIYFFTDEAIQSVQAANLIHNGFRDISGTLFPTYFQNGAYFNLSLSVYAQIIPYLLFGFSVIATRGVSVLIALSGGVAIGLTLRDIFKVRYWWIGLLILSITPAFFLHSRTAFETVLGTACYAWFLYFYLRYRYRRPRNLYAALLFGALAFYAYSPLQAVVVATGVGLLLSDARYHVRQWRYALSGLFWLIVLALPYLRFQAAHPDEAWLHLRILDSYLVKPEVTTAQKIARFWSQYTRSLSPAYWYGDQVQPDLIRHVMQGYGRLPLLLLPFTLIGLILSVSRFKSSANRALLIALLVTTIGGSLGSELQVYRMLAFVVPTALLAALGLIAVLERLHRRIAYRWLAIGVFSAFSLFNVGMLNDALVNGPTWFTDYQMGGLQYGGAQLFAAVRDVLQESPTTQVRVSSTWANGTDVLLQFFMPDEPRVQMGDITAYQFSQLPLNDDTLLVMTPGEYAQASSDPKFTDIRVERTIPYPDGQIGFYFVRLKYSPQAPAIFAADEAARRQPETETITLNGQPVSILHSKFDIGQITAVFDGDPFTLVRTLVDNPAIIEITFSEPRILHGLNLTTATMDYHATVKLTPADGSAPLVYSRDYLQQGPDPAVDFPFDPVPPVPIKTLRLEVKDLNPASDGHIHIREIQLR